jgi:hypothetical protein
MNPASTPHIPVSLRFILILSSHLRLGLKRSIILPYFPLLCFMRFPGRNLPRINGPVKVSEVRFISRNICALTIIMFLDIIHRVVHFLKHNVSETGFCLRPQVKPTQLDPIDGASPYLQTGQG